MSMMDLRTLLIFFMSIFVFPRYLHSQICIELPAVDGIPAVDAAPPGWIVSNPTPDIINGLGPYPGGGYVVENVEGFSIEGGQMELLLHASEDVGIGDPESIQTTLTGLTIGETYIFYFEWQQCKLVWADFGFWPSFEGGRIKVDVDGIEYEYTSAGGLDDDWMLEEVTFTATGTTAVITFSCFESLDPEIDYYAVVFDNVSCDEVVSELNITLPNDTICVGDCIDLIAEVTSGTEPYTFEWGPGIIETGDSVNVCPVVTTTYEVIVVDALGETDTNSATITVLSPPIIDLGSDTILCEGESLTLDAENPGSTYLWQDGSADQTFSVTTAGIYWVEINNGGCSSTDSITVTYIGPEVNLGPDTALCIIEDFVLDAGNPGMDYLWQDGSTDQTFEVVDLGTYFVTVSDAGSGCVVSDTIVLSPGSIIVDLGNDTVLCAAESLLLDAENPGATYLWSDGSTDQTLSVSIAGLYKVEVEQGICSGSDSIMVSFQNPVAEFTADNFEGCAPEEISFTDLSTPVGEIATWAWDFDDGGTSGLQNPNYLFTTSGIYDVTLEVTTAEGCTSTKNHSIEIMIYPSPEAAFTSDPDNPTLDELINFMDQSINAEAWFWDFGDGETSTNQNPTHNYSERGIFDVTLIVNNEICYDTTRYTIIIEEPIIFYVPNVFTPDGDNFNQIFQPIFTSGFDPYNFHITIFNRWGELVFESYDASKGWNGTYGNKGIVQDGVYVWKIEFGDINSDKKNYYAGHVTVLK
jgi:gliding motility-associated-like protein